MLELAILAAVLGGLYFAQRSSSPHVAPAPPAAPPKTGPAGLSIPGGFSLPGDLPGGLPGTLPGGLPGGFPGNLPGGVPSPNRAIFASDPSGVAMYTVEARALLAQAMSALGWIVLSTPATAQMVIGPPDISSSMDVSIHAIDALRLSAGSFDLYVSTGVIAASSGQPLSALVDVTTPGALPQAHSPSDPPIATTADMATSALTSGSPLMVLWSKAGDVNF